MSGAINIKEAEDNYYLPRVLAIALLKNICEKNLHWLIETHGMKAKKEVENINIMI